MFMPILSGLIVSVDAFFIGLSLGMQKKCKFMYLAIINIFLFILCMLGFFLAGIIYEQIPFDPDIVVGFAFIALGLWTMFNRLGSEEDIPASKKTFVLVGLVMSFEAMLITMGLTIMFSGAGNIAIPLTVALAHFAYSTISFYLAKTKHAKKVPHKVSQIISGAALVIYGLMALFVEIGV